MKRKIVFVCSPLSGDFTNNIKKAETYCRNIALAGDIPIAPHIYFTRFLDEYSEKERDLGIEMGMNLLDLCDEVQVFSLYGGISKGMKKEIEYAESIKKPITYMGVVT